MPTAKQYAKYKAKMLENPELYIKEKERINNLIKNRYANDEEYRNKCIQYQKEYHSRKKNIII